MRFARRHARRLSSRALNTLLHSILPLVVAAALVVPATLPVAAFASGSAPAAVPSAAPTIAPLSAAAEGAPAGAPEPEPGDYAAGHILVEMKPSAEPEDLIGSFSLQANEIQEKGHLCIVPVPAGTDPNAYAAQVGADPDVQAAEVDYFRNLLDYDSTPNDPGYTNATQGWWQRENGLNLAPVWEALNNTRYGPRATSEEITVAVLDSGYHLDHPDAGDNIVPMKDEMEAYYAASGTFVTDSDVTPTPLTVTRNSLANVNHGTMVAGQIAAAANNGIGVIGAGYDTKVLVYKVAGKYYAYGSTEPEFAILDGAMVAGIDDAVAAGADIISISIGGTTFGNLLQNAINRASTAGVMIVAAAGNEGRSDCVYYPAACENVIGVGSYEYDNVAARKIRAPHSNYGVGADPTYVDYYGFQNGQVDILSPGTEIYGLYRNAEGVNGYASWTGTSMATPAFAATAALIWRFAPNLTASQITDVLMRSATPDGEGQPNLTHGWGYVDPLAAYQQLVADYPALPGPEITAPALVEGTAAIVSWTQVDAEATYDVYVNGTKAKSRIDQTSATVALLPNQANEIEVAPFSRAAWYTPGVATVTTQVPIRPTVLTLAAPAFRYYNAVALSGKLTTTDGTPLAGAKVTLQRRLTATGTRYSLATATTGADGSWSYAYNPVSTWERSQFITATYAGQAETYTASSADAPLPATIYLSAPKKSVTTPTRGRSFTITGTMKPRFAAGTRPVRAMIYKKSSTGSWAYVKAVSMKASNYSTYSKITGSTYLSSGGSYRVCFRYTGAKAANGYIYGTTYGTYHYFSVR